jgi:hypothetical protein
MSGGFVEGTLLSIEALLVEASFRSDAVEPFLRACLSTPRHHQPAAVPGLDGKLYYRQFSCRDT